MGEEILFRPSDLERTANIMDEEYEDIVDRISGVHPDQLQNNLGVKPAARKFDETVDSKFPLAFIKYDPETGFGVVGTDSESYANQLTTLRYDMDQTYGEEFLIPEVRQEGRHVKTVVMDNNGRMFEMDVESKESHCDPRTQMMDAVSSQVGAYHINRDSSELEAIQEAGWPRIIATDEDRVAHMSEKGVYRINDYSLDEESQEVPMAKEAIEFFWDNSKNEARKEGFRVLEKFADLSQGYRKPDASVNGYPAFESGNVQGVGRYENGDIVVENVFFPTKDVKNGELDANGVK